MLGERIPGGLVSFREDLGTPCFKAVCLAKPKKCLLPWKFSGYEIRSAAYGSSYNAFRFADDSGAMQACCEPSKELQKCGLAAPPL